VIAGGVLVAGGVASLVGVHLAFGEWLRTMLGLAAVLAGVGAIFGPSLRLLTNALVAERRERIRADERSVISSHLHDSVLQTLTLIQKRSADPAEVQSLARRQERELRQWLYDGRDARVGTVRGAFEDVAAEVEDRHRVTVECVVVGDRELDEHSDAVVLAAREALVNAAKFSGETRISLYAEIGADSVQAFVRDRGVGFDQAAVAPDRKGIAESIVGRMERVGGSATVRSTPDGGTEVTLMLSTGDAS
jgi:signal transduction histidine kinase